jgi:cyclic-di-AMP phosphodiesterase PgpH
VEKLNGSKRVTSYRNPVYQGYVVGAAVIMGLTLLLAPSPASFLSFGGLAVLVTVLLGILYVDIRRYRSPMTADPGKLVLLGLMLAGTVAVDRIVSFLLGTVSEGFPQISPDAIFYALPTASGAMLATLLLDTHLGLTVGFVLSLLIGITVPEQPFLTIYTFVGCVVAVFGVIYCRRRTQLLKAGGLVGLTNVIMVGALHLYGGKGLGLELPVDMVFGLGGGLLVALVVSGALPILESFFKMTTNIRLLELLDLNQPLLRRLSTEAPGTYYHSMMVSNLAEAAAETVGENPVFVRVCCYYHDVGKMVKPNYFIENQADEANRHDRLNPHLSSMIVISHVKQGIELARRYNLPESIIDMIPQHHGTRLVDYFYDKARRSQDPFLRAMEEQEFRYPGPKPQTKVAGIIMLADAVEASCRALKTPTPQRISGLVDRIVANIFLDGQLEESDLTIKDLKTVQETFKRSLTRQHHRRIEYPGMDLNQEGPVKIERSNHEPKAKRERHPPFAKKASRANPA